MANFALLLGSNGDDRKIIAEGNPVAIRKQFKEITEDCGFELVEVIQKDRGLTRKRKFAKAKKRVAKKAAKKKD